MRQPWRQFLGDFLDTTDHRDKLIALVGGAIALYLALEVAASVTDNGINGLILASLGATAVLLFAVPHGALSQPWNVLGGHAVSAIVGILMRDLVPHPLLAAALAVGLAIWAMHYLRCLHPPGGATALYAVVGGGSVDSLGPVFVLHPVLSSVSVMVLAAVAINYPFAWRRYPAALTPRPAPPTNPAPDALQHIGLAHDDLEYAMRELNLYLDMSEDDMARLYLLARRHHEADALDAGSIRVGECYSNGRPDPEWEIRKVIAREPDGRIRFRTLAGPHAPHEAECATDAFAAWACQRVDPGPLLKHRQPQDT